MKKIQELIEIVSPLKLKGVEVLGKTETLVDQLYHLLQSRKISSDEEAMTALYANTKSKKALYQLKEKLYNKLIDSVFVIDMTEKNHTDYDLASNYCKKYTAVFEFISFRSASNNIFPLGNKILKLAVKFNLASIITRVTSILIRKAAVVYGDEKLLDGYREMYLKYREIDDLTHLADYYWYKISLKYSTKRMISDKGLLKRTNEYADILEKKLIPDHTCKTFVLYASLRIRSKEIDNDYKGVILLADKFLSQISSYKDVTGSYFNAIFAKKLLALITLRRYAEANKTASLNLKYLREGQKSWFTLLENKIILSLYEKKYDAAFKVYISVTQHSSFRFLKDSRKEIFKVYRAYFQFFINIGMLEIPEDTKEKRPFRYARFNNEVHIFSKDKKGINISIIVAQFLLLFTEGKYKHANDKIESVKSYTRKHLRVDATFRSNCFLKMLVRLVESDYHKAATIRRTKDLYQKLKNHPADAKRQSSHVEIVPFEQLWEIILDRIDNSFKGTFKSRKPKK